MHWRLFPELPLLRRELTELANRRRTYVVRVIGAIVLLCLVFTAYAAALNSWAGTSAAVGANRFFGIGRPVFARIVPLLFYAIQILLPALCCASITTEKERNTIGTLFLTRLSPWAIILEKVFSRIVPMLTILLLASPVLAYVYSLGGVDAHVLLATFWLLLCECLLFASIAIMCSAWFPTTVGAFVGSYSLIAVLGMLSATVGMATFVPSVIWQGLFADNWNRFGGPGTLAGFSNGLIMTARSSIWSMLSFLIFASIPALLLSGCCLTLTRLFLVRRAFISSSSVLLKLLKAVDGFFTRLNERTTGGIEIVKDSSPLPGDDPVAWRERNKKSLGKFRYLVRILLLLEGPTLFICTLAAMESSRSAFGGLYVLEAILWALAAMIVAVKAATLFSSERARETIQPLLATPLTTGELLQQKISGMRRLLIVVAVPLLTVNLTHVMLRVNLDWSTLANPVVLLYPLTYLLLSVGVVGVLLFLIAWLCAAIGLRVHSQTKSVLAAVAVIGIWVALPGVLLPFFPFQEDVLIMFSPGGCVYYVEQFLAEGSWVGGAQDFNRRRTFDGVPAIVPASLCLAGYTGLLFLIRWLTQTLAPRLLNRLENPAPVAERLPEPRPLAVVEG